MTLTEVICALNPSSSWKIPLSLPTKWEWLQSTCDEHVIPDISPYIWASFKQCIEWDAKSQTTRLWVPCNVVLLHHSNNLACAFIYLFFPKVAHQPQAGGSMFLRTCLEASGPMFLESTTHPDSSRPSKFLPVSESSVPLTGLVMTHQTQVVVFKISWAFYFPG